MVPNFILEKFIGLKSVSENYLKFGQFFPLFGSADIADIGLEHYFGLFWSKKHLFFTLKNAISSFILTHMLLHMCLNFLRHIIYVLSCFKLIYRSKYILFTQFQRTFGSHNSNHF